jgi:hypothetical protein
LAARLTRSVAVLDHAGVVLRKRRVSGRRLMALSLVRQATPEVEGVGVEHQAVVAPSDGAGLVVDGAFEDDDDEWDASRRISLY